MKLRLSHSTGFQNVSSSASSLHHPALKNFSLSHASADGLLWSKDIVWVSREAQQARSCYWGQQQLKSKIFTRCWCAPSCWHASSIAPLKSKHWTSWDWGILVHEDQPFKCWYCYLSFIWTADLTVSALCYFTPPCTRQVIYVFARAPAKIFTFPRTQRLQGLIGSLHFPIWPCGGLKLAVLMFRTLLTHICGRKTLQTTICRTHHSPEQRCSFLHSIRKGQLARSHQSLSVSLFLTL